MANRNSNKPVPITENLRRVVDQFLDDIRDEYRRGTSLDKIAGRYRLTSVEMKWIEDNLISNILKKVREDNRKKFASLSFSVGTPDRTSVLKDKKEDDEIEL